MNRHWQSLAQQSHEVSLPLHPDIEGYDAKSRTPAPWEVEHVKQCKHKYKITVFIAKQSRVLQTQCDTYKRYARIAISFFQDSHDQQ